MNAGGVPNTCKSNEKLTSDSFGMMSLAESGERVSNAWVIYPVLVGDNPPKGGLIPHNIFSSKEKKIKDGLYTMLSLQDEPASY